MWTRKGNIVAYRTLEYSFRSNLICSICDFYIQQVSGAPKLFCISCAIMFLLLRSVLFVNVFYVQWEIVASMQSQICAPVRLDHQRTAKSSLFSVEENTLPQKVALKISAFEQDFVLDLQSDSSFIAPSFSSHADANAQNSAQSADVSRCFYAGEVNSDPLSYAALSLCKGLQGAFGYGGWEYFIKPASNDTASPTDWDDMDAHLISRRSNLNGNSTSRCGVDSGVTNAVAQSLAMFRHLKEQHIKNMSMSVLKNRSKRFVSIPRYVETLVVADESMAKFHGDDLKHYVLTLMSVAARLYKHPTILNSINIVVVKFMVINEEEKGPKVSGNAAMTLRNFCIWQKKLNKNNDKHPEYWDTAILFTKQVRVIYVWSTGGSLQRGATTHRILE